MGCSTKLYGKVTKEMKKEIKECITDFQMPVYTRSMPKHYEKYPDRDYSVNRAERRKRKKMGKKRGVIDEKKSILHHGETF